MRNSTYQQRFSGRIAFLGLILCWGLVSGAKMIDQPGILGQYLVQNVPLFLSSSLLGIQLTGRYDPEVPPMMWYICIAATRRLGR